MDSVKKLKTESGLSLYHPWVSFVYFVAVIAGTLLFIHPVFVGVSLLCAIFASAMINGRKTVFATLGFGIPMFIFIALANPLFKHRGATILCYLFDNPVTLEAIVYGIVSAGMMFAAVVWFTCYNTVVTSDKFIYIFGRILPSIALIVSMTLSLIPRLLAQVKVISDSQRSIGLDWKSGSLMQRIRSGARILSILVSWALEDAVITADSMRARGYGQHKRSTFSIFRFGKKDAKMLALVLVLFTAEIFTYISGRGTMEFYPAMVFRNIDFIDIIIYFLYITLGILPAVIQIKEDLKWKLLK
ncbi:MAG: energy-coupling factor transporter transmembrane protein EcfT [Oscillospiraceae bacterium]|nr:energy-coupling factor transporter transmembrane protein EcfT [Oscillospiraceae bacterium]